MIRGPLAVANSDRSLAGYMAAVGAGLIATSAGVRTGLSCGRGPEDVAALTIHGQVDDIAAAVARHARHHANGATWPWVDHDDGRPLFVTTRREADWEALETAWREAMPSGRLNRAMIHGIGWPTVWGGVAASGGNPLDTVPRNRGMSIVTFLRRLAPVVGGLSRREIAAQLADPEAGEPAADIRWSARPLSPVRAWCALWGLAAFPVTRRPGTRHPLIPGHCPGGDRGEWLALPAGWQQPMTPWRWRRVVARPWLWGAAYRSTHRQVVVDDGELFTLGDGLAPAGGGRHVPSIYNGITGWGLLAARDGVPGLLLWQADEARVGPQIVRAWKWRATLLRPAFRGRAFETAAA